jgi:hypothetical protein
MDYIKRTAIQFATGNRNNVDTSKLNGMIENLQTTTTPLPIPGGGHVRPGTMKNILKQQKNTVDIKERLRMKLAPRKGM